MLLPSEGAEVREPILPDQVKSSGSSSHRVTTPGKRSHTFPLKILGSITPGPVPHNIVP